MASSHSFNLFDTAPTDDVIGSVEAPGLDISHAEWFVAETGYDVGPLSLEDLEARWKARDLGEETLVWRPGMADWQPVAEVADLTYMVIDLPQGGAEVLVPQQPVWRSTVVVSLADLAAWEHETADEVARPEVHSGLPSYLSDFESLGFHHHTPAIHSTNGFGLPVAPVPSTGWPTAPHSKPRADDTPPARIGFIAAGAVALALAVGQWALSQQGERLPPGPTKARLEALSAEIPLQPLLQPQASSLAGAPVVASTLAPKQPRRRKSTRRPRSRPAIRSSAKTTPTIATTRSTRELSRDDIVTGTSKNAGNLAPCIRAAQADGEIAPGRHRFVLSWKILPNGRVSEPRLKGPRAVLGTSLPGCLANKMLQWKFLRSGDTSTVNNFPMPVRIY